MKEKTNHYNVKATAIGKASIKDVDFSKRVVTGFFNTYNFLDSQGDVLLPGCAKKSIKECGCDSNAVAKIKHALNHDLSLLPAKIQVLKEDTIDGITGIYFESKCVDTTLGNDTLTNYQEGIYDNHSIGFRYRDAKWVEREGHGNSKQWQQIVDSLINPDEVGEKTAIYVVKDIELFEGSTVAFGANSLTPYLGVKSQDKDATMLALF